MSFNHQGKRKEQVEFSYIMVGISIVGTIVVMWFYATYNLLKWWLEW